MTKYARHSRNMRNVMVLFHRCEGREIIVFDTETTGKKKEDDYIVELSAIKCIIKNGEAVETNSMDLYIKPPLFMSKEVTEIHGITNEFLADKPYESDLIDYICDFFGDSPIIVGHNIKFDIGFMEEMYKRCDKAFTYEIAFDTLEMARDIINIKDIDNYKLSTIATMYGLDKDLTFHCAIDDVKATLRILTVFKNEYSSKIASYNPMKEKLYINSFWFWKGRNKSQSGIYVNTNMGKIYLSTYNKCWVSTEVDLDKVNIDDFEDEIVRRTGLPFEELSKMTESKWNKLKK